MVIAYHIILTGYGHWLPNDLRGSMSRELRQSKFSSYGDIHYGRKTVQPDRESLKAFLKEAQSSLAHDVLWFDEYARSAIGASFGEIIRRERYTCFACAVMSNHAHLLIRRHRDKAEQMIETLSIESAKIVRALGVATSDHPIWSRDEYKRFIDSVEYLEKAIEYVRANPEKSGMPPQEYEFTKPYRGEWRGSYPAKPNQTPALRFAYFVFTPNGVANSNMLAGVSKDLLYQRRAAKPMQSLRPFN